MADEDNLNVTYDAGSSATISSIPVAQPEDLGIELVKYGTGKPTREVIRAKIINGAKNKS